MPSSGKAGPGSMRQLVQALVDAELGQGAKHRLGAEEASSVFLQVFRTLSAAPERGPGPSQADEALLGEQISSHLLEGRRRDRATLDRQARLQDQWRRLRTLERVLRPEARRGLLRLLYLLRGGQEGQGRSHIDYSYGARPRVWFGESHIIEPPSHANGPSSFPGPHLGWHLSANGAPGKPVVERQLLRDLLHALLGMNSRCFELLRPEGRFEVSQSVVLSRPAWGLCDSLLELADLHVKLRTATGVILEADGTRSLLQQALCEALRSQLQDYHHLLAMLMAKTEESAATSVMPELTLGRLWACLQAPLQRMRLLTTMCEACTALRGGALASTVHGFCQAGDVGTRATAGAIQQRVLQPLLSMISAWMTEGELQDPYGEFFVCAKASVPLDELWSRMYALDVEMVPCFLTLELARKILLTGKSVNFIRLCCPGQHWLPADRFAGPFPQVDGDETEDTGSPVAPAEVLELHPFADLRERVEQVARTTNTHLVSLLMEQFALKEHCLALRLFLLLGQGDFVEALMDMASSELDKDAREVHKHQLLGVLDMAVRQSNAQFCSADVIARINVTLLDASTGEKGWDIFLLDYAIDSPLHVIFTPAALHQYRRAFMFLWKLKRASHSLSSRWREHMALRRHLTKVGHLLSLWAPTLELEMKQTLHRCTCLRNEMHHFVQNIHSYVMCEVLETSWAKLQAGWESCADLDQVILEHQRYLACIAEGAFLAPGSGAVLAHLTALLDFALEFCTLQDQACSAASDASTVEEHGEIPENVARALAECRAQLDHLGAGFLVKLQSLLRALESLPVQSHLLSDLRFLLCRLDFNGYYEQKSSAPFRDRIRMG